MSCRVVLGLFAIVLIGGCPMVPEPGREVPVSCSPLDSFEQMTTATYAVVVRVETDGGQRDVLIGTAFAVDPWLLATNAHVVQAIEEIALLVPIARVLALQAGDSTVVPVDVAILHPQWNGDPLRSPDIGLLQLSRRVDDVLPLASEVDIAALRLGSALALTGFPGDVEDAVRNQVGISVLQPTALSGAVTAFRTFRNELDATAATHDVLQHQIPVTPGTSGAPIVACGRVVAINNAGTVQTVVGTTPGGELFVDRVAAASNNFGIHVRYLDDLVVRTYAGEFETAALQLPRE